MFSQFVGVLLFLSVLIAVRECQVDQGDVPLSCPNPNEEPSECGPSCGDRNCTNQSKNNVKCTKECKAGCFCKGGYVRNSRQVCVPSYMCGTG
ncbi:putative TIL domain polypeptide [Anopheles sinensis]|uniref:Putative TIL domain polypeptide n=1 Tax=Anopheles sinensis TaxID=74873 RepID=A0A084WMU7_ANOSI|nr:putative TIL domain polypeptide [Anopheles sinensis]